MHDTAMQCGAKFLELYWKPGFKRILDIGSQDVNGSLRQTAPADAEFVGIDIAPANGVDVVWNNPSGPLPFEDNSFDVIVSTSCFEHDQTFWNTFAEAIRVTRPGGYVYINAPSNGTYHSYPYDNWRFYPDSVLALIGWAASQGHDPLLVESLTLRRKGSFWNDCVMVIGADSASFEPPQSLLSDALPDAMNIRRFDKEGVQNFSEFSEDMQIIIRLRQELGKYRKQYLDMKAEIEDLRRQLGGKPNQADE